jgi:hypothetical protein
MAPARKFGGVFGGSLATRGRSPGGVETSAEFRNEAPRRM